MKSCKKKKYIKYNRCHESTCDISNAVSQLILLAIARPRTKKLHKSGVKSDCKIKLRKRGWFSDCLAFSTLRAACCSTKIIIKIDSPNFYGGGFPKVICGVWLAVVGRYHCVSQKKREDETRSLNWGFVSGECT